MSLEMEFDKRIAAIYGLNNPSSRKGKRGDEAMDIRQAEFQAMADVFLGEGFDRAKLKQVEDLQIALYKEQTKLYESYEAEKLDPEEYVKLFNALLDETFLKCEEILGQENFSKFFGASRSELAGFIDKETFLQAHQSRRVQAPSTGEIKAYIVSPDDSALISAMIKYSGKAGDVNAYLSRPKNIERSGAVIVIHENRGLVEHIKDVARRFAKEGFVVLAPDLVSRLGGTDQYKTPDEAVQAVGKLTKHGVAEDLNSAVDYLKKLPSVTSRIGVVGFCWGGGQSLNFATKCKDISAAVVYYGRNPDPLDEVKNIPCPLLGNYGEDDPNIMPGVQPLMEALRKYTKNFDIKVYPGAKHAFNNNTNPDRYNPEAAKDAWIRTVGFLRKNLLA
jgi:carboxymethylenebutenolidase